MLERKQLGEIPQKPHTLFHQDGKAMTEFVFTRDGFSGGYSILYQRKAPTSVKTSTLQKHLIGGFVGTPIADENYSNQRRHLMTGQISHHKDWVYSRTALCYNAHTRLSIWKQAPQPSDYAFCNGDADELHFIQTGQGVVLTMFGSFPFKQHDYILIPCGVAYRFVFNDIIESFITEGKPFIEIPQEFRNPHGQLRMEAPYTHRDFISPQKLLTKEEEDQFCQIMTLKNNSLTLHEYKESPLQTVGWDGSVYPMKFSIYDYLPKTGKIHLPPNLHLTFRSKDFVICSFVPRMLDYLEGAIPCPYPHFNSHCDEILYYVAGNFTSRKCIGPKSITHHPGGLPHGPQPGNYHDSVGKKSTDELAVMVDTWSPLSYTQKAFELEDQSYMSTWLD